MSESTAGKKLAPMMRNAVPPIAYTASSREKIESSPRGMNSKHSTPTSMKAAETMTESRITPRTRA